MLKYDPYSQIIQSTITGNPFLHVDAQLLDVPWFTAIIHPHCLAFQRHFNIEMDIFLDYLSALH